jgi:hypothetical protein
MNYVLQFIVLALAVIAGVVKSIKTDPAGKTLYLIKPLPLLTTTGKVVLALLLVSFALSVVKIRASNASEEKARTDRDEMAGQLKQANTTGGTILDHQTQQFGSLIDEQTNIARDIRFSANELQSSVRSSGEQLQNSVSNSTTLIRGRVDKSIDVLNHSARNIESLAEPIKDIYIDDLTIDVPLDHPEFNELRATLENPATSATGLDSIRRNRTTAWFVIRFHKTPLSSPELVRRPIGDLHGVVFLPLIPELVAYDRNDHSLRLEFGGGRLSAPPMLQMVEQGSGSSDSNWHKSPMAAINGIPDLLGSELTVEFFHTGDRRSGAPPVPKGFFNDFKLVLLELRVSPEHRLMYADKKLGRDPRYYIDFRGFFVMQGMQSLIDEDGYRVYHYRFPNTWIQ